MDIKKGKIVDEAIYEAMLFRRSYTVSKYLEGFEIAFAKHIIRTYILPYNESLTMDGIMGRLFASRKTGCLDSKDVLRQEIHEIGHADTMYMNNPDKYETGLTPHGYADEFRCKFIIYSRHRFQRCSKKISDECSVGKYCKIHMEEDNIYESIYNNQCDDLESDSDE